MFKTKRLLSAVMATAMLLSVSAFATQTTAYGDYTVEVSYLKTEDNETTSMTKYLVSNTIPVTYDENGYTLAIDIHNYFNDSYAATSQMQYVVDADSETYTELTLIDVSDEYDGGPYDRILVTVDSLDTFTLRMYVDIMEVYGADPWQSFRVAPDATTLTPAGVQVSSDSMSVSASVAKNVATSSVVIPESTNMGELSKTVDTVVAYEVEVNAGYGQSVTVTADESVTLTCGETELVIVNDFDGESGTLTASAEDVAAVASYDSDLDFAGSLAFTITVA